jgi:hypothetical protein
MLIAHVLAAAVWTCSVPLLPDYRPKTNAVDVGEGVTYLYVGDRHLRADYGADAVFITPLDGRRGWYDSAIHSTVAQLRLKRDSDHAPVAFESQCIMHRYGIFWQHTSPGTFVARGAFYPNESTFFTGVAPDSRCRT